MLTRVKVSELKEGDKVRVTLGRGAKPVEGVVAFVSRLRTTMMYEVPVSGFNPDGKAKMRIPNQAKIEVY